MRFDVNDEGDPLSAFVQALGGRRIDLLDGSGSNHVLQLLLPKARPLGPAIKTLLLSLDDYSLELPGQNPLDATKIRNAFRALTYDMTEVMDVYSQALPERLVRCFPHQKAIVREFQKAAATVRAPWATLCNKFKHGGSQLAYNRAVSRFPIAVSQGYILLSPHPNESMLRDREVHAAGEDRTSFLKKVHQAVHDVLKVDGLAAKLIDKIGDADAAPLVTSPAAFPFGKFVDGLSSIPVFTFEESNVFGSVERVNHAMLELSRRHGTRLRDPVNSLTQIVGDGFSRTFTFT